MLKSLVGSRPYPTAGRLVWSDAEGFNSLAAVMYSTSFDSYPFVRTTEPSIAEEPFPADYRLPNWEGVRVSNQVRPDQARPIPLGLCCTAC